MQDSIFKLDYMEEIAMVYKEIKQDLFSVPEGYYLAHCISADFKLGAGIALGFNKRFNMRQKLFKLFPASGTQDWDRLQAEFRGLCIVVDNVYNLVTKRNYYDKPTVLTMGNALLRMKEDCGIRHVKKIAMPKIGCGLDKLKWEDVSHIIQDVFQDTDVEILVCCQ